MKTITASGICNVYLLMFLCMKTREAIGTSDFSSSFCSAIGTMITSWINGWPTTIDPDRTWSAGTCRRSVRYLRSNLHRTDYPTYLAADWEIGSGKIESACKTIVGQRLKGPGMRWRERGTTAVCQLRALFKSDRNLWTNYWHPANSA